MEEVRKKAEEEEDMEKGRKEKSSRKEKVSRKERERDEKDEEMVDRKDMEDNEGEDEDEDEDDKPKGKRAPRVPKKGSLAWFKAQNKDTAEFAQSIKTIYYQHLCQDDWFPRKAERTKLTGIAYQEASVVWHANHPNWVPGNIEGGSGDDKKSKKSSKHHKGKGKGKGKRKLDGMCTIDSNV
jgi:hypothetical protein